MLNDLLKSFIEQAQTKIDALNDPAGDLVYRRKMILDALMMDPHFESALSDPANDAKMREVIGQHTNTAHAQLYARPSAPEKNGDNGFFVLIAFSLIQRNTFFTTLDEGEWSFNRRAGEKKDDIIEALKALDVLNQETICRAIDPFFEGERYRAMMLADIALELWNESKPGPKQKDSWEVEWEARDKRFAGSLPGRFNAAIEAVIEESQISFNQGKGATLRRGVAGLLNGVIRHERVMLKSARRDDFVSAVERQSWRNMRADDRAMADAVDVLWEELQKIRQTDAGWRAHRRPING